MKNNFKRANLAGADFTGSNLRESNFTGADLRGTIFDHTDLRGCDFTGAAINDETSFIAARLDGAKGLPSNIQTGNVISLKRKQKQIENKRFL